MTLRLCTLDFETYWSDTHSLSKMSPIEYVRSPETELISVAIKLDDAPTEVFFGEDEIGRVFDQFDFSRTLVVGHNLSMFDSMILAWRLGVKPALWGCTLAMARPVYGKVSSLSLAALAKHCALGAKDSTALVNTKGKHLADFTSAERDAMAAYNREDTELCYRLFRHLKQHFTPAELWHLDATIRMLVEPKFVPDQAMLDTALSIERSDKHKHLLDLARLLRNGADVELPWEDGTAVSEWVREQLASAPKFSALLERRGVEVPMKPSPTSPDKQVPALAKTDEAFIELQEHDDPVVAAAARARLAIKSTLLETRIQAFLDTAAACEGRLPVPLNYCGAMTTGRDSGTLYNCFTGETEVLTPQGWVRFDHWDGRPIMQWWSDGRLTFEGTPGALIKHYDGPLVDVDAVLFSSAMTPEHRLVSLRGGRAVERTAGWLATHSGLDGVPTGGRWCGVDASRFTPAEVRLLVAIAADGTVVPRKTKRATVQIGLRKQRKVDRLHQLLGAVGVPYNVREHPPQEGHTGDHPTTVFFIPDCPYGKGFGSWILELSADALEALVDETPHWDGWRHHKTQATEFSTNSRTEAEWFATAVHLTGRATTIREHGSHFQMHVRETNLTSIGRADVETKHHTGLVYCASVDSSYILIRRNGKIAVAGQCQNLPRLNKKQPKTSDALRACLRAPPGHLIAAADQSGIELRVNHFLWRVPFTMRVYRADPKADLYRAAGAEALGIAPDQLTAEQRQMEKVKALGLGFGAGGATFQRIARVMGGILLTEEESALAVADWRERHSEIAQGWKTCGEALVYVAQGLRRDVDPWGMVTTCAEGLRLPSGRLIRYPELRFVDDGQTWPDGRSRKSWVYGHGRHKAYLSGPKVGENVVQALARDSIFERALLFFHASGFRPLLRVHDELVYAFPESEAAALLAELQAIVRRSPTWWPELVVWSEGGVGVTYAHAK